MASVSPSEELWESGQPSPESAVPPRWVQVAGAVGLLLVVAVMVWNKLNGRA